MNLIEFAFLWRGPSTFISSSEASSYNSRPGATPGGFFKSVSHKEIGLRFYPTLQAPKKCGTWKVNRKGSTFIKKLPRKWRLDSRLEKRYFALRCPLLRNYAFTPVKPSSAILFSPQNKRVSTALVGPVLAIRGQVSCLEGNPMLQWPPKTAVCFCFFPEKQQTLLLVPLVHHNHL